MDILALLLLLVSVAITMVANIYIKVVYNKYKRIKNRKGITGFEVARKILDRQGLTEVHVVETVGVLTDHYDPIRKVVRLSSENFHGSSIAATAVAAHEVGHAIQHKVGYTYLKMKMAAHPYVNFANRAGYFVIFIGLFAGMVDLIMVGVVLLFSYLLFQLIALPIEYEASNRAATELINNNILEASELNGSKVMLNAAALTYVAAVIVTKLQILRLIMMATGRRN